jgi:uncharacterized protein involved in cysteine biosynthesis
MNIITNFHTNSNWPSLFCFQNQIKMLVDENIIWKKVFLGFVINLLVVIAAGWIFISRLNNQRDKTMDSLLDWIEISLFVLSIILLIVVYFIIKSQLRAKKLLKITVR